MYSSRIAHKIAPFGNMVIAGGYVDAMCWYTMQSECPGPFLTYACTDSLCRGLAHTQPPTHTHGFSGTAWEPN